jgi:hypothetical protein
LKSNETFAIGVPNQHSEFLSLQVGNAFDIGSRDNALSVKEVLRESFVRRSDGNVVIEVIADRFSAERFPPVVRKWVKWHALPRLSTFFS